MSQKSMRRAATPPRMFQTTLVGALFFGIVAVVATGCPGTLENPERFKGGCPDVPAEILGKKCGTAFCHDATTKQSQLDLVSSGVATRVKNVPVLDENVGAVGGGGPGGGGGAGGAGVGGAGGVGGQGGQGGEAAPDVCTMGLLADTTTPENSLIYTKTLAAPPCGSRMPLTGAGLSEKEQQCLLEWISSL
jgi:hypothetical protein